MVRYLRSIIFWFSFVFSIVFLALLLPVLSLLLGKRNRLHYFATASVSKLLLLLPWVLVEIAGKESLSGIDKEKGLIIAANHASFLDYFVLQKVFDFPIKFAVWSAGFKMPLLKRVYEELGYVGVGVKGENIIASYQFYQILKEKGSLVILSRPSFTGEDKIEYGEAVIKLSLSAQSPILPVAIKNASKVLPLGKYLFDQGRIKVKIGKPAFFDSTQSLQNEILRLYHQ